MHDIYRPVGYIYQCDEYCLDCTPLQLENMSTLIRYISQDGGCNCTEHVLDRIAEDRGIDRHNEGSFDSSDFPKYIAYHNDLHVECGDQYSWDGEFHCYDRCAACGKEIDGPCPVMEEYMRGDANDDGGKDYPLDNDNSVYY